VVKKLNVYTVQADYVSLNDANKGRYIEKRKDDVVAARNPGCLEKTPMTSG
jgi:hypothetical protein